ncbi:dihydrofolate reductase [Acinetobacter calcoaceticus]|uniref:Dihydrofolate reductase n=1 Tax=Acinetobacter calcoaceticus TaxID=471 RepID=A0A4R1XFP2_ACICA|nr:dihydrofolate reductase [Acinetobacter calcoaceticus]
MEIVGYIASSADGYIATQNGSVDFLSPYQHIDCGYAQFIQGIDVVIMGRKTYEVICGFGGAWPYPDQLAYIVSSDPCLAIVHPSIQVWTQGVVALAEQLKQRDDGRAWVVGGTQLQNAFIELRLLDRLEIYEMPVCLGDGIRLFPALVQQPYALKSMTATLIEPNIIKKIYQFK